MNDIWCEFEKTLNIAQEDEEAIRIQMELIDAIVKTREEKVLLAMGYTLQIVPKRN